MTDTVYTHVELLRAIAFAAERHRHQRRKGKGASPYINHPIAVAETLAVVGGITDLATLQAAVLHDTIEDTDTMPDELEQAFGAEVRDLVVEVTDDKALPKLERKRLQIEHAPHLSARAKAIKIVDKIHNVRDITDTPPDWPLERQMEYLDWAERVVAGCRGVNDLLERSFDEALQGGRELIRVHMAYREIDVFADTEKEDQVWISVITEPDGSVCMRRVEAWPAFMGCDGATKWVRLPPSEVTQLFAVLTGRPEPATASELADLLSARFRDDAEAYERFTALCDEHGVGADRGVWSEHE